MEKNSYFIIGVWKENGSITHVQLLDSLDVQYNFTGEKVATEAVVKLIDRKKSVSTLVWDYKNADWKPGAPVGYETRDGVNYLRTHPDDKTGNNLDNAFPLHFVMQ